MHGDKVMIVTGTPPSHLDAVLSAISGAGGGELENYTHCAFTVAGYGRFKPAEGSQPFFGRAGEISQGYEIRIETFCERDRARAVVAAIREAHPYEVPVIYIIPLLDEGDL